MRSVVVVLPASMCAMMPMLRTLFRSVSTSCATGVPPGSQKRKDREGERMPRPQPRHPLGLLPAVVGEGAVRLGHLVGVFAALDRSTQAVRRVEDLVGETLGHGLLATGLRVAREPPEGERVRTVRLDLDGDLVGRTADAARTDLEGGAHVVERLLEDHDRVLAGLVGDVLERLVDDALREVFLAVDEDLVDELADDRRTVDRIGDDGALRSGSLTRHYFFSIFAPYLLRPCLRFFTACVSSAPRTIL